VLPAPLRRELSLQPGSELLLCEGAPGEWRLVTRSAALERVRATVRRHVKPGESLVDELLAERRRDAAGNG